MQRTRYIFLQYFFATLAAYSFLLTSPASGQASVETTSGLSLTPPAKYTAQVLETRYIKGDTIRVVPIDQKNVSCVVTFNKIDQRLIDKTLASQSELNTKARDENLYKIWNTTEGYDIVSKQPFEHLGVLGEAIVGDRRSPVARPGEIRSLIVTLIAMKGVFTAKCGTNSKDFDRYRSTFEAIIRSTSFPQ